MHGTHAFTAEAIAAGTAIERYPVSRLERLAACEPRAARELSGIISDGMSRLHLLVLILGRTTAEQKIGSLLLYMHCASRSTRNRIIDRDALADEDEIREVLTWPAEVKRRAPSAIRDVPQTGSVEVRVPPFAFGDVLSEMRRWLDHELCEPSGFTCVREGSGAVIIRVEFAKESGALVEAFKQEFASPAALASG